jgi:hypothetical protein
MLWQTLLRLTKGGSLQKPEFAVRQDAAFPAFCAPSRPRALARFYLFISTDPLHLMPSLDRSSSRTDDLRVAEILPLLQPALLMHEVPLRETEAAFV